MLNFLNALRREIGDEHVITDSGELTGRSIDGRGSTGAACALVRPKDAEQVSATLKLAAIYDARVVPQGARTGLVGGSTADDSGAMVLLSLERLNRTLTIDPVNRSATVEAGVLLSTLNAAAAGYDLMCPIDLGADPTIGGMVAANTGGARFLRYGDVRRNLLGLEVVLADGQGTRLELGGALWKDNSRLDLKQMLVGASGSLGVVTCATLALQPIPGISVCAMIALRDPRVSEQLLCGLETAYGSLLTAFEGISPAAYEAALGHVSRLRRPFARDDFAYFLLVELSAGPILTAEQIEEMLATSLAPWMQNGGPIADVAIDHHGRLWEIRHAVPEGLRGLGKVVGCDISLRRGDISAFREEIGAELARNFPELQLCDFGHIGDGGLHFNLVWPHAAGSASSAFLERAREHVFAAVVERYGGSFSAEHGIGPRNIGYYERWTSPIEQMLARQVQSTFAPAGIGRVAFGPSHQE